MNYWTGQMQRSNKTFIGNIIQEATLIRLHTLVIYVIKFLVYVIKSINNNIHKLIILDKL